ncbi:hypothetical protein FQR65_LT19052 [Abscondita terminalis]|nr:hypothetical protein FQR65_LT19052 [Abscondita terminalis]
MSGLATLVGTAGKIISSRGQLREKRKKQALLGIQYGMDPNSPDYFTWNTKSSQPLVDAAYLVQSFMRAPKALWEPLPAGTKANVIKELKGLRPIDRDIFILRLVRELCYVKSIDLLPFINLIRIGMSVTDGIVTPGSLVLDHYNGIVWYGSIWDERMYMDHRKDKENILVHKARLPVGHWNWCGRCPYHRESGRDEPYRSQCNSRCKPTSPLQLHGKENWLISPRTFYKKGTAEEYDLNPEAKETIQGDLTIYNQPLKAGGGYAVVYKTHQVENGKYIVASIGYSQSSDTYVKEALQLVERVGSKNRKAIQNHQPMGELFCTIPLQIPDTEMQIYQMQLYKLSLC